MAMKSWIIDGYIQGAIELKANDTDAAQEIFETHFRSPKLLDPLHDGDVSKALPYHKSAARKTGGGDADQA